MATDDMKLLARVTLRYEDPNRNSDKGYCAAIFVDENRAVLQYTYGRWPNMSTKGKTEEVSLSGVSDPAKAIRKLLVAGNKQLDAKRQKGYLSSHIDGGAGVPAKAYDAVAGALLSGSAMAMPPAVNEFILSVTGAGTGLGAIDAPPIDDAVWDRVKPPMAGLVL